MNNFSNISNTVLGTNISLAEWNQYYVKVLLYNIIWNIICLLLGVIGNSMVLMVYIFKIRHKQDQRFFIPVLALLDLLASSSASAYFLTQNFNYVSFPSSSLCRILKFVLSVTSASSAHMLLVLGIQRYLKICRPLGRQMTIGWRRFAVVLVLSFTIFYSSPLLFAAGNKKFNGIHKGQNVTGVSCTNNASESPLFKKLFSPLLFAIVMLNFLATVAIYIPIGHVIYKAFSGRTATVAIPTNTIEMSTVEATENETQLSDINHAVDNSSTSNDKPQVEKDIIRKQKTTSFIDIKRKSTPQPGCKGKKNVKVNFNMMFMTIAVFYLLSYIPTATMFIVRSKDPMYWFKLSDVHLGIYRCLQNFYIVNHIVNPLIYGYFDFYFRESFKSLFKC